jgi:hypothetical protein
MALDFGTTNLGEASVAGEPLPGVAEPHDRPMPRALGDAELPDRPVAKQGQAQVAARRPRLAGSQGELELRPDLPERGAAEIERIAVEIGWITVLRRLEGRTRRGRRRGSREHHHDGLNRTLHAVPDLAKRTVKRAPPSSGELFTSTLASW